MKNVFIINAHEPWPFSEGKLNRSMVEKATVNLKSKGYGIQMTTMQDDYNVLKNPDVENDFVRFDAHLDRLFPLVA